MVYIASEERECKGENKEIECISMGRKRYLGTDKIKARGEEMIKILDTVGRHDCTTQEKMSSK